MVRFFLLNVGGTFAPSRYRKFEKYALCWVVSRVPLPWSMAVTAMTPSHAAGIWSLLTEPSFPAHREQRQAARLNDVLVLVVYVSELITAVTTRRWSLKLLRVPDRTRSAAAVWTKFHLWYSGAKVFTCEATSPPSPHTHSPPQGHLSCV